MSAARRGTEVDSWLTWLQVSLALLLFVLCARLLFQLHQARRNLERRHRDEDQDNDGR